MERSQPVCIAASVMSEVFTEQCSLDEFAGSWSDLEEFWGREKQRLQNKDGQTRPMSNSLEEQLMHEDFINEPKPTEGYDTDLKAIHGEEIKDIPTSYMIGGFKPHELIVIGTYVDKNIIPGFQYRVRKNPGHEYLFGGRALHLENIGLGYGKRLTFSGDSLNDNQNFFWSDSQVHGFAFTFQCVHKDAVFAVQDLATGRRAGRVIVNAVRDVPEAVLDTEVREGGWIKRTVSVDFNCDVVLSDLANGQNVFVEDVQAKGVASVVRGSFLDKAEVTEIVLEDFVVEGCKLIPED